MLLGFSPPLAEILKNNIFQTVIHFLLIRFIVPNTCKEKPLTYQAPDKPMSIYDLINFLSSFFFTFFIFFLMSHSPYLSKIETNDFLTSGFYRKICK
jgi:hypothetical protein